MKRITLNDFEKNHVKKTKRWLGWFSLCLMVLLGSTTMTYGQGQTCINPLTITSIPYTNTGNTSTYGNDYTSDDVPPEAPGFVGEYADWYLGGDDVVFSITPTSNGTMDVSASGLGTWTGIYVFTGCPFAATVGAMSSTGSGTKTIPTITAVANTTYYIVISTWPTPDSTPFTLSVTGSAGLLTPLTACTGTPNGGTASLNPANGNAGANFTASATNYTLADGLTFQWQKSVSGTWTDISGATTAISTITAEAGAVGTVTDYRLAVTCTASAETAYSSTTSYTTSLVYCPSVPTGNDNSGITNVTLGTSSIPVADVTYYNHPTTVNLIAGITNQALVTFATGYSYWTNIWIDLNDNGTFETPSELVYQGESLGTNPTTLDASFLIDAGATIGLHKMRIGTADSGQQTPNPCYSGSFGVTVDMNVNVLAPPTCLPPSALTALNITATSAELSWTSNGTLFDVKWGPKDFDLETAGTLLTGISIGQGITLPSPNTAYSYYVRQDCGNSDLSYWSGPFTFKTLCAPVPTFSENFDSYTLTGANNPLPSCWSKFGNTGNTYIATGATPPFSGANRLYLNATATGTTLNAVAVLPGVSNLQAGTHRLKFKAFATAADKILEIGYYDVADDPESFIVSEVFDLPSTTVASAIDISYTPQFIPAGVESLAFRNNGPANLGTTTIYIDNVVWEPIPACFDISVINFSNITASSVDVNWSLGGSESAWEYVVAPNTVTSPAGLTPVLVENNPSATIDTGLNPSTVYNFWIRSKCANNVYGNWSAVKTFTTACSPVTLPWTEGFEGVTTVGPTAFPLCWSKENGDWATSNNAAIAYMKAKSGNNFLRNTWSAVNEYMWTPGFNMTAGVSYDFSFYMASDGVAGWVVELFQNTQQVSTGATPIGAPFSPPTTGTSSTLQPYALVKNTIVPTTTGVYYFALRINAPVSPNYIGFDDFRMEVTPTCDYPLTEAASNITSTSATVSWTSNAVPANGYEYYRTSDLVFAPTASTTPTGTVAGTASLINLTGLDSQTTYNFFIRALCSASDISSWSGATTFTTACAPVATFSQNFDTSVASSSAPMPLCWERAGTGSTYVTSGGGLPATAPNRLYMYSSGFSTPATQSIAKMPPVSNLQANTHRLKFKAYASTAGKTMEVGYFTNATDLTTFVAIETVTLPGTAVATAQTYTINPASIPAGIFNLAFRVVSVASSSTTAYIDDVVWEAKPSLAPVCATNIVATPNATCGNFATAITWTAAADADGYYLKVGTTSGASDVVNNLNVGLVTSYNFVANANTTYFYSITPFNSAGSATGCEVKTYTTATGGCYCPSNPSFNDGAGISNVQIGIQNFPTGDVTYFDHTATPVDISQGISNNMKITFATDYPYATHLWIDLNDNFNFEANELFFSGQIPGSGIQDASFLMPANAALGMHRMRIVSTDGVQNPANPCFNGSYGVTLDFKVNITAIPTCLAPTGLSVDAGSITTNSATINWTASTSVAAEGYDYYVSTTAVAPTASTAPLGSVGAGITTANLVGLASSSIQYVYVRSKCSTTDLSSWSQPLTFFTLCDTNALPYTIDFESVTVPNLPVCTINENVGSGNNWETNASPGAGFTGKALKYNYNSANAGNTWFFTNRFNVVAGTEYNVSYKFGTTSTFFTESMQVSYGATANSTAMTTELANHPTINSITTNVVTFTPTTTGSMVIGFRAYSAADELSLFLDDIVISQALGTGDFNSNKFVAYPNPVKNNLTIRYNENIKDVTVFNLLGQQLFVKNINATEGQIDMSNLPTGTYLVKVNSGDVTQTMKVIKE